MDAGSRSEQGRRVEEKAAEYLREQGLAILDRNFRVRGGELDIVAREGDAIVIVEVRSKRAGAIVDAATSITPTKGRRIARAARAWLLRHRRAECPVRFDAVLVETDDEGEILSLVWQRDFFTLDDL
jgi:putative endonuclease